METHSHNSSHNSSNNSQNKKQLYSVFTTEEHIRNRPENYLGSMPGYERKLQIINDEGFQEETKLSLSPGLERCVIEILINACDNVVESKKLKIDPGEITLSLKGEMITITNQGRPIPIEMMDVKDGSNVIQELIPTVIFSKGFSSSHYDDTQERESAGLNGVGAKACNICSKSFTVRVNDGKKYFEQSWWNSALGHSDPIVKSDNNSPKVEIEFELDMNKFPDSVPISEAKGVLKKLCSDAAIFCNVPVHYKDDNGHHTYDYRRGIDNAMKMRRVKKWLEFKTPNTRFYLIHSEDEIKESFVNATPTRSHGEHVDSILYAMLTHLKESYPRLNKVSITNVTNFLLCSTVDRPTFDGMCKDKLTTKVHAPDMKNFVTSLQKKLPEYLKDITDFLERTDLEKMNKRLGGKRPKLATLKDANFAGKPCKNTEKRRLWITEGLSASKYAKDAIMTLRGNYDYDGTLALKGVPMAVRKHSTQAIANNVEIQDIQLALGLKVGNEYTSTKDLRYDEIVIAADADVDGHHIRNLIIDMFEIFSPSLLKLGFLVVMHSPIYSVNWRGKDEYFYTETDYKKWLETSNCSVKPKYCKGLGSTKTQEIIKHMSLGEDVVFEKVEYGDGSSEALSLAFSPKEIDNRKKWILGELECKGAVKNGRGIPIAYSIQSDMLPHSRQTLRRAIPNYMCGMKESEIRTLWVCLNSSSGLRKVDKLIGDILDTGYKHGAASLYKVIIGLASGYPGTNNLPYLVPDGNFGSRDLLGKDAAAPRYLETKLRSYVKHIFKPEDNELLTIVDGCPLFLLPVIDMLAVNGARGIATGWSTFCPSHNPDDVIEWLIERNKGNVSTTRSRIQPYYRHFKGKCKLVNMSDIDGTSNGYTTDSTSNSDIVDDDEDNIENFKPKSGKPAVVILGEYKRTSNRGTSRIEISEFPVYKPFKYYNDLYVEIENTKKGVTVSNNTGTVSVNVKLEMSDSVYAKELSRNVVKVLELSTSMTMTNMNTLDENNIPQHHTTVEEGLERFYQFRLPYYEKRRLLLLDKLRDTVSSLIDDREYIAACLDGKMTFESRSRKEFANLLDKLKLSHKSASKFPTYDINNDKLKETEENIVKNKEKIEKLKLATANDLWLDDLYKLREVLRKCEDELAIDMLEPERKEEKKPRRRSRKQKE